MPAGRGPPRSVGAGRRHANEGGRERHGCPAAIAAASVGGLEEAARQEYPRDVFPRQSLGVVLPPTSPAVVTFARADRPALRLGVTPARQRVHEHRRNDGYGRDHALRIIVQRHPMQDVPHAGEYDALIYPALHLPHRRRISARPRRAYRIAVAAVVNQPLRRAGALGDGPDLARQAVVPDVHREPAQSREGRARRAVVVVADRDHQEGPRASGAALVLGQDGYGAGRPISVEPRIGTGRRVARARERREGVARQRPTSRRGVGGEARRQGRQDETYEPAVTPLVVHDGRLDVQRPPHSRRRDVPAGGGVCPGVCELVQREDRHGDGAVRRVRIAQVMQVAPVEVEQLRVVFEVVGGPNGGGGRRSPGSAVVSDPPPARPRR